MLGMRGGGVEVITGGVEVDRITPPPNDGRVMMGGGELLSLGGGMVMDGGLLGEGGRMVRRGGGPLASDLREK